MAQFDSLLTQAAQAWPESDFVRDMAKRHATGKHFTPNMVSALERIVARAEYRSRQESKPSASVDASNILGALVEAKVAGLKKPALRLQDGVVIKYMSHGTNAGGAWVTKEGILVGKIDSNGEYTPRSNTFNHEFITEVNNNVQAAIVEFGRVTGRCGCCGLELTKQESIDRGIGPICAEKYFGGF